MGLQPPIMGQPQGPMLRWLIRVVVVVSLVVIGVVLLGSC